MNEQQQIAFLAAVHVMQTNGQCSPMDAVELARGFLHEATLLVELQNAQGKTQ